MPAINFKKWTPHLLMLVIMAALALFVCMPAVQGEVLNQHDVVSWKGMSQEAKAWYEKTGEVPLWSNSMFGGNPTYLMYMAETKSYFSQVYHLFLGILPKPANFFFLAMACFYILSQVLRMNRWLGLVGALGFAFATYNPVIISAGHDTKMVAIAYMPLVLAGFILLYRGKYLTGGALFGSAMGLMILSGHYQIVWYMGMTLLIAGIGYLIVAIRKGTLKNFAIASAIAIAVSAIGAGTAAVGILPAREYNEYTMRGGNSELTLKKNAGDAAQKTGGLDKDYAFKWSQGLGETFTLLVPDLYGGASSEKADRFTQTAELVGGQYDKLPGYWGPQPFLSGPVYLGAIICFLFVLGMIVIRNPMKWALAAAAFFGILLSLGKHMAGINYLLFDTLPLLKNFRTPSMALVIPQLIFPVVGIWGIQRFMQETDNARRWKALRMAAGITAGLALLLGIGGSLFFDFTNPETDSQLPPQLLSVLREDRASMARLSGLRSAFFILAAAAVLWAWMKNLLKAVPAFISLAVIVFVDLQMVDSRYLNSENYVDPDTYDAVFVPRQVDKEIMADPDPYFRVLDLTRDPYNDAIQAYFFKAVGGYSPAKMESYQDLIDVHLTPQTGLNTEVLNMLNTKYLIMAPQGSAPQKFPNSGALGNAWFVQNVKYVNTANEEMIAMSAPTLGDTARYIPETVWSARNTAVVRNNFQNQIGGTGRFERDSAAAIRLTKYGLNSLEFESSNTHEGLAVFSDMYYDKGWKAFVDGKETPIVRANYVLRAIKVPAGNHKITFRFEPQSFKTGNTISAITSILLFLLIGAALFFAFRQKEEQPVVEEWKDSKKNL